MTTQELLEAAKGARAQIAQADSQQKNAALIAMAEYLLTEKEEILAANEADLTAAKGQISEVMLDRLRLDQSRIEAMAEGIRQVAALPDPVGKVRYSHTCPNGLKIDRVGCPIGVVAIIYESRPNVTSDAAALAIKSVNACILRCGK